MIIIPKNLLCELQKGLELILQTCYKKIALFDMFFGTIG